mmetsp:Transcript_10120/g.14448  ORF Transcript_10120/g.14448 Transcript_10120/m.14448 type:complete len:138 (-) Transcript_10120:784-1197(-)
MDGAIYGFPSDIWSVGLIALEGILGHFPYPEFTSHFDLVNTVVNGPPPTENPVVKQGLSLDLWQLLDGLVAKEPADRPDCYQVARSAFMLRMMSQPCDLAAWFRMVAAGGGALPGGSGIMLGGAPPGGGALPDSAEI